MATIKMTDKMTRQISNIRGLTLPFETDTIYKMMQVVVGELITLGIEDSYPQLRADKLPGELSADDLAYNSNYSFSIHMKDVGDVIDITLFLKPSETVIDGKTTTIHFVTDMRVEILVEHEDLRVK